MATTTAATHRMDCRLSSAKAVAFGCSDGTWPNFQAGSESQIQTVSFASGIASLNVDLATMMADDLGCG